MGEKMKWIFVTAGVGSSDFENAAARLARQISGFSIFDEIRVFNTEDVFRYCPEILDWHSRDELLNLKGFGWYVWKSRFVLSAIKEFPDLEGIMYLDAGCEALPNYFSRKVLLDLISKASSEGACVFKLSTPEASYTKKLLLDRFGLEPMTLEKSQFQSGSWLFRMDVAKQFLSKWDSIVWEDVHHCDESVSPGGEIDGFIVNRYDQSVFSPLVRDFGFESQKRLPPGDLSRIRSRIKFFFFPFAWARNRSGNSLESPLLVLLAEFSLRLGKIFHLR